MQAFRRLRERLYSNPSLMVPYLALGASAGIGLLTRSTKIASGVALASMLAWNEASKYLVIEDKRLCPVRLTLSEVTPPKRQVWLTFDDGPAEHSKDILDVLHDYSASATFFFIGSHTCKHKDLDELTVRLARGGHKVGNHSWSHPNFLWLDQEVTRREIIEADIRFRSIFPELYLPIFRPPYGYRTRAMLNCLQALALEPIGWSINSLDFLPCPAEAIASRVLAQVKDGSIILFHDGPCGRAQTVKALPKILEALIEDGYTFVTPQHQQGLRL